jgi:hypothetical protein
MGNSNNRRTRNQTLIRLTTSQLPSSQGVGGSSKSQRVDCGITLPHRMMSFYHVRQKRFEIGHEELAKCVLLCPRCHLERLEGKENDQELITILKHNINEMYTYLRVIKAAN